MLSPVLVALLLLAAPRDLNPTLVGAWSLAGHTLFVLKADGTGSLEEDAITWRADGRTLSVRFEEGETETIPYVLAGDQLTATISGTPLALQRGAGRGGPGPATAAGGSISNSSAAPTRSAATPRNAPNSPAGRDPLAQLLLSSAWCTFHYNQASGSSSSQRVQFFADGTWSNGARYEGSSSGSAGTFSSQHDSGGQGRWESRAGGNELWMSSAETNGQLMRLPLIVTRNSNGYPVLNGDGKEYSMCP